MRLRTYYWHDRIVPAWKHKVRRVLRDDHKYFTIGNAGDILVRDIVHSQYGAMAVNIADAGQRMLIVGSVSHRVKDNDVLAGVGTQGKADTLPKRKNVSILGLRGPITYDEFKAKGYDMSQVKFLLDPGLLVRFMFKDETIRPATGSVAFIPHYRERNKYKNLPSHIRKINIDDKPANVCKKILEVEHVFSSSLHGIIFAHALGRPATLVEAKNESMLKYKDYYSSVGLDFPTPLRNFDGLNMRGIKTSPEHLDYKESDFIFPSLDFLVSKGVICQKAFEKKKEYSAL